MITASSTTIGAAVGAAFGGPPGALIGGLVGAGIGITVAAVTTFWDGLKVFFVKSARSAIEVFNRSAGQCRGCESAGTRLLLPFRPALERRSDEPPNFSRVAPLPARHLLRSSTSSGGTREPWDTCVQTSPETANPRASTRQIAAKPRLGGLEISQGADDDHLAAILGLPAPSEARLRAEIRVAPLPATITSRSDLRSDPIRSIWGPPSPSKARLR